MEQHATDQKTIIVKIQRSLLSTNNYESMLVYDETREFLYEGPMQADIKV